MEGGTFARIFLGWCLGMMTSFIIFILINGAPAGRMWFGFMPVNIGETNTPQHYAWTISVTYTDGTADTVILHKDNDTDADLSIMLNVNGCIQTFVEDENPENHGESEILCGIRSFQLIGIEKTQTSDYK